MNEITYSFDDSTWIIADTHFFHANIGQYCSRPEGWQDLIIENWNRLIQPGDTVFHMGDLALGKKEDTEALIPLLNEMRPVGLRGVPRPYTGLCLHPAIGHNAADASVLIG